MKFHSLKALFSDKLSAQYGAEEAIALFYVAFEQLTQQQRSRFLTIQNEEADIALQQRFESVLHKLELEQPIQYVLEEAHFYGLVFKVNSSVLIPRPETEELVDWIIKTIRAAGPVANLLDLGTGSGCIAISLKVNISNIEVHALDTSTEALQIAGENADANHVEIKAIKADIRSYMDQQQYDIIVSNPPYIRELEMADMHAQVLAHEPHLALFVSNDDPLVFYKAIASFALTNLSAHGLLFFEINEYLGSEAVAMLKAKGFSNVELRQDMQGKDRMIKASLK